MAQQELVLSCPLSRTIVTGAVDSALRISEAGFCDETGHKNHESGKRCCRVVANAASMFPAPNADIAQKLLQYHFQYKQAFPNPEVEEGVDTMHKLMHQQASEAWLAFVTHFLNTAPEPIELQAITVQIERLGGA